MKRSIKQHVRHRHPITFVYTRKDKGESVVRGNCVQGNGTNDSCKGCNRVWVGCTVSKWGLDLNKKIRTIVGQAEIE